jgi:aryl-alcohol dehydrogenase-like predicted oxidoreductase
MEYRRIGDSDLRVSEISLGSWLTYGGGVKRDAAAACINHAFELGINFIDTANVYNRGGAETLLGEVLESRPRESYVLATKLFFPMTATDRGLSRQQIEKQLDDSLRRLRTDYVDLYQCHRYDPDTPLEETMDGLSRAVESGKARYVGFSEWTPDQIQAALDIPDVVRFVSSQPQYSMLWRVIEPGVIPLCEANGIGQIVWSPLAQGVLTGKYPPGVPSPEQSRANSEAMGGFMDRVLAQPVLEAVSRLQVVAADAGLSMAQLALAWILRQPNVACAIVGATRPGQLDDNVGASGVSLSDDTLQAIDAALGDVVVR